MSVRRPVLVGVVVGLVVVLVGAGVVWWRGGAPPPAVSSEEVTWPARPVGLATPAIVWPSGPPDDGVWAQDEWVRALRDLDLALAVANNAKDYSDSRLADVVAPRILTKLVEGRLSQAEIGERLLARHPEPGTLSPEYFAAGPTPMYVLGVEVRGDEATVSMCAAARWDFQAASEVVLPTDNTVNQMHVREYVLIRFEGRIVSEWRMGTTHRYRTSDCDPDLLRPGYFDPPPPYGREPFMPWEIIGTDGQPMAPRPEPSEGPAE